MSAKSQRQKRKAGRAAVPRAGPVVQLRGTAVPSRQKWLEPSHGVVLDLRIFSASHSHPSSRLIGPSCWPSIATLDKIDLY